MKRTCLVIARVKVGLSQKEVAKKIGVSQQSYAKYENGTSLPHSFEIMNKLEEVLKADKHCMFKDLFEGQCKCGGICQMICKE